MRAIVIPQDPAEGEEFAPIKVIGIEPDGSASCLGAMQAVVGGNIQALPTPFDSITEDGACPTAYVHEEGKFVPECRRNSRATKIMGHLLFPGDYISGDLLLIGLRTSKGETWDLPSEVTPEIIADLIEKAG